MYDPSYLDLGVGAVGDEYDRGEDVDEEPQHGYKVRRQPDRHLADEPVPPGLEHRVEQAGARTAVPVLGQPLELSRREYLVLVEEQLHLGGVGAAATPRRRSHAVSLTTTAYVTLH